ncbi:hypothetical protein GIB67_022317 [Kingdonia uniflora]|uniref:Uncharacterized protein n=1 Tax=Kingdonia uniflora TaxID=39325 RepID=A0A7J7KW63_9MAGN|nr:hypothetical protein GIB67_022317 [Kingdonia uniflora]
MEQSIALDSECHTLKLLNLHDIEIYLKKYNYLHVGYIQVAFKPLTLLEINSSILGNLRDERSREFKSSLMGIVQTSICHKLVYFDVYPNLTLSFTDKSMFDAISLRIQTHGYNFIPEAEVIAVIYKIHYKVMNTLCPRAILKSEPGTTVAVHSNCLTTNIAVNRLIDRDKLSIPTEWVLPRTVVPRPSLNSIIRQFISNEFMTSSHDDFKKCLKGWRDNVLIHDQKIEILGAIKREGTSTIPIKDIVYTLIQTVILHYCSDANTEHWKARFIDGLLPLFTAKVRQKL